MKILEDDEARRLRARLEEQMSLDPVLETSTLTSLDINWIEGNEYTSWEAVKSKSKELMAIENNNRNIFLCHSRDIIEGKPQLVHPNMKTIVLMKKILKIGRDEFGEERSYITNWKFLDEHYDKRYDGNLNWEWTQDFWIYKVTFMSKEYYILSKVELEMKNYRFEGMIVDLNDRTEMNNNLKLKSISKVFFLKKYEPTVKILSKEGVVDLVKSLGLDKDAWFKLLNLHPLQTINNFPEKTNLIRTAQLLSGKMDGWGMHLAVMGRPGTRKSFGYIETTAYKFGKDTEIVEGANSRIKSLSPSFKEKPANIGYLARAERMGFIDELGKMVEFEMNKHQSVVSNILGELNFLLDGKKRTVGSGNDNDCVVQASAKFLFASNGVRGKDFISHHVGLIDPTTMSRIVWWIQDNEETNLVLGENGITRVPLTHTQALDTNTKKKGDESVDMTGGNIYLGLCMCWGDFITLNHDYFLTIFDTCNSFLCHLDPKIIQSLVRNSTFQAKEPMKSIWKPRAEHHVSLIVDGLCKFRCLFEDYDSSFIPQEIDYQRAEKLITSMIRSWDVKVSIREDYNF